MVDARRAGEAKFQSSLLAETGKLLIKSSYEYQILGRSKFTKTKYLNDEVLLKAIDGNEIATDSQKPKV